MTWWLPVIVLLEIWRHLYRKLPIFYNPRGWSMVFCLGMYTVCTMKLAEVLKTSFLKALPDVFIWIALAIWLFTFLSMCLSIGRMMISKTSNFN